VNEIAVKLEVYSQGIEQFYIVAY